MCVCNHSCVYAQAQATLSSKKSVLHLTRYTINYVNTWIVWIDYIDSILHCGLVKCQAHNRFTTIQWSNIGQVISFSMARKIVFIYQLDKSILSYGWFRWIISGNKNLCRQKRWWIDGHDRRSSPLCPLSHTLSHRDVIIDLLDSFTHLNCKQLKLALLPLPPLSPSPLRPSPSSTSDA